MATTALVAVLNVPTSMSVSFRGASCPKHSSSIKASALSNRRKRSGVVCSSSSPPGKGAVGRAHDSDRTANQEDQIQVTGGADPPGITEEKTYGNAWDESGLRDPHAAEVSDEEAPSTTEPDIIKDDWEREQETKRED